VRGLWGAVEEDEGREGMEGREEERAGGRAEKLEGS